MPHQWHHSMDKNSKMKLHSGWVAKRAGEVEYTGEQLSNDKAPIVIPEGVASSRMQTEEGWLSAVVPGTVLTTLVKNGVYPDPLYGLNNNAIPDIYHAGRDFYTFWFCNTFELPQYAALNPKANQKPCVVLAFRGINYSAEVYFNGTRIELTQPRGMFLRRELDVTDLACLGGANRLAVLVHPPDHPGCVDKGGQGGDHDIAKDVTAEYVEGWDWICPIRDRNTGIWDEVSVHIVGPVQIQDPHLVASFDDPTFQMLQTGSGSASSSAAAATGAKLHISAELRNPTARAQSVRLTVQVTHDVDLDLHGGGDGDGDGDGDGGSGGSSGSLGEGAGFCCVEKVQSEDAVVPAGATLTHTFVPLLFERVELWWPNNMGEAALYQVQISAEIDGFGESDAWSHRFGFRHISHSVDPKTGGRLFQVNGQPLFVRGANWIVSDAMLRLSQERYNAELAFHAGANLNMMRVWGGALAERPHFYDACDRLGLLVWQEFWITGDCNGRGTVPSDPTWPLDHDLFLDCARDTVRMLRNHASLALWVGGNETKPPPDINAALIRDLRLWEAPGDASAAAATTAAAAPALPAVPAAGMPGVSLTPPPGGALAPLGRSGPGAALAAAPSVASATDADDPSLLLDGARVYVEGSLWNGFGDGKGGWSDGPYEIQEPEWYFREGYYKWGFNPEIGNVGVPESATIRATFPPEFWSMPTFEDLNGEEDLGVGAGVGLEAGVGFGREKGGGAGEREGWGSRGVEVGVKDEGERGAVRGAERHERGGAGQGKVEEKGTCSKETARGEGQEGALWRHKHEHEQEQGQEHKQEQEVQRGEELAQRGVPGVAARAAGPGGVRAAATAAAAAPAGGADGAPGRKKLRERSRFHYREVPNVAWDYHTFIPYSQPEKKIRDQLAMYGLPRDLDDFCEKAQVVNFVQYRALLESWGSGMWARYTGMLIWKTQNPWPGLRGQLYDFLLDVGGGLYGVASGAEPVHVQLNLHTRFVEIVNTTGRSYEGASVKAAVINLDGTSPDHSSFDDLSVLPFATQRVFEVPDCTCLGASDVYFLLLTLSDISGSQISRNFYWLYAEGGDYTLLDQDFRSEKVPLDITAKVTASGKRQSVSVTLTNNGGQIYGQEAATSDRSVSGEAVDVAEMNQLGFEVVPWQNDADIKDVGHTGGVPFRTRKGSAPLTGRGPARFGEDQNLPGTSGKLSGKVQSSFPQGSVGRVAFFIRLSVVEEEVPSGCPSSAKLPGRSSRAMPAGTRQGPTAKPSISDQLLATSPYVETRILPTSYSDNYFSLVPGESKVVTIRFPTPPEGKAPVLKVKGWNVAERLVAITN